MRCGFVLIVQILFLGKSEPVDWCQKNCEWSGMEHLRCRYKEIKNNTLCSKIRSTMTPQDRKLILHYHNVLRDDVARGVKRWRVGRFYMDGWKSYSSGAADMRQMVWDPELEENAKIYASQCTVKAHMAYHCANPEGFPRVHMNKFDQSRRELTMQNAVIEFAKGKEFIPSYTDESALVSHYAPGLWEDFFVMIHSKTYSLGCSKVVCGCKQIKPLFETGSVVCIYGPAPDLDVAGFPSFAKGSACESCSSTTTCKSNSTYKHLCARREDPLTPKDISGKGGRSTEQSLIHFLLTELLVNALAVLAH